MGHSIELAHASDAAEILSIYTPFIQNTTITFEYEVPSIDQFAKRITSITEKFPYLIYKIDGSIVGYAYATTFRTRAAFMWDVETSVYIKEEFQHTGVAHKLYTALFSILKKLGYYNAYAYISIPNTKSVRFHEKHGFIATGEYTNTGYKLGQWCSLLCMTKVLTPITQGSTPVPYLTIKQLDELSLADSLTL